MSCLSAKKYQELHGGADKKQEKKAEKKPQQQQKKQVHAGSTTNVSFANMEG